MYFNADFLKNRIMLTSWVFAQRVTFAIIIISHIKVSISHRDYLPDIYRSGHTEYHPNKLFEVFKYKYIMFQRYKIQLQIVFQSKYLCI